MAGLAWRGTTLTNRTGAVRCINAFFSLIRYRNTLYSFTRRLPSSLVRLMIAGTRTAILNIICIGMNVSMPKRKRASGLQCILYNNILYRETKFCTRCRLFCNFLSKSTLIFDKRQNSSAPHSLELTQLILEVYYMPLID